MDSNRYLYGGVDGSVRVRYCRNAWRVYRMVYIRLNFECLRRCHCVCDDRTSRVSFEGPKTADDWMGPSARTRIPPSDIPLKMHGDGISIGGEGVLVRIKHSKELREESKFTSALCQSQSTIQPSGHLSTPVFHIAGGQHACTDRR